jgi:CHAT domain-containing protein
VKPKIFTFLFILVIPVWLSAQTQDDYYAKLSDIYVAATTDKEEARKLAKELFQLVKDTKELQDYANYFALSQIFTTQAPDKEWAKKCKDLADAALQNYISGASASASTQVGSGDANVALEWSNKYFTPLFENEDPKNAIKALKYLSDHPQLQDFNNYTYIAYAFEKNGDFPSARKYYAHAMTLVIDDKNIYLPYSYHANFLSKSGEYLKADEMVRKIERLSKEAIEVFRISYYTDLLGTRSWYYLYIGDYLNYIEASNKMYDHFDQVSVDLSCTFTQSSRLMINAYSYETLKDYKKALEFYTARDAQYRNELTCYNDRYPKNKQLMLSMLPIFEIKIGLKSKTEAQLGALIKETETYYKSFKKYGNLNTRHMKAVQLGFLGAPSYHEQFDKVQQEINDTKDFSESTLPFSFYAYFTMRDRSWSQSKNAYDQLFKHNIDWINDLIFTFGEKAFITYFNNKLKIGYENFHSFVKLSKQQNHPYYKDLVAQAYDNILLTKSIGFKSTQKRKKAFLRSNDASVVQLYNNWMLKKQQLMQSYQKDQSATPNQKGITINNDSLTMLQTVVDNMENELSVKASGFQKYLKIRQPKWKEVRNKLKDNEAAIEMIRFGWRDQVYYADSTFYAAYIIKKNSAHPEVVYLPTLGKDLEQKHYNLYRNSIRLKIDESNSYEQYWQPIQNHLDGIDKVFFSPDGIYHLINLPTLKNGSTNKFLLNELQIQNVTTTALTAATDNQNVKTATLIGRPAYEIAIAQPVTSQEEATRSFVAHFRDTDIDDLPGTEDEIVTIQKQMTSQSIKANVFLSAEATEQVLYDLDHPDILHIATHGYWSKIDYATTDGYRMFNAMVNSGLLLAGVTNYYQQDNQPQGHDGILTAYEAQNLALEDTDLVVLSACETGLGHFDAGEGVYGLQRAFRAAGAKSVMTSLWKVDDTATKEFMIAFYDCYLSTNDKIDAFRKAQLALKNKYPQPYYWGAFVMTGE